MKAYTLQIQSYGDNEHEAVERAIRMLNEGADFDEIISLPDTSASQGLADDGL